ncbi:MAG: rRNA maturation RNase YbeY [Planctomycetota bacterium]
MTVRHTNTIDAGAASDGAAVVEGASSDDPGSASAGAGIDGGGGGGVEISIEVETAVDAGDVAWVAERAAAACGELGLSGRLGVAIVGDAAMSELHEQYKQVSGTTDVLTFDLNEPGGDPATLDGDVAVCWDEAARQAAAHGHAARAEALLYVVHGVMHLIGEDDGDEAAAARMHAREDAVLEAIGVGAIYSGGGPRDAGGGGDSGASGGGGR